MDYEKAYKEALERAKGLIDFCSDSELKTLENVFPELRESDDEGIRKELMELVSSCADGEFPHKSEWLAWLEKQREQNHWKPCIGELVELGNVIEYIESGKSGYKGGISYLKTLKENLYKL